MLMLFAKNLRLFVCVFALTLSGCSLFVSKPVVVDTQENVLGPIDPKLQQGFGDALALLQDEKFKEAEVLLLELTSLYPEFAGPWSNLAIAQGKQDKYKEALDSAEKAISVDAQFCQAVAYKGVMLRELGQFKQAKDAYLEALSCNPNDHLSLYNLGVLSDLYLHDEVAALDYYQRYIQTQGAEPDSTVQSWIVDLKRRVPEQVEQPGKAELPVESQKTDVETPVVETSEPQLAGEE